MGNFSGGQKRVWWSKLPTSQSSRSYKEGYYNATVPVGIYMNRWLRRIRTTALTGATRVAAGDRSGVSKHANIPYREAPHRRRNHGMF